MAICGIRAIPSQGPRSTLTFRSVLISSSVDATYTWFGARVRVRVRVRVIDSCKLDVGLGFKSVL